MQYILLYQRIIIHKYLCRLLHGFVVLSEKAIINYEVNKSYDRMNGLIWNDKTLNIKWPVKPISKRDSKYNNFQELLKESVTQIIQIEK